MVLSGLSEQLEQPQPASITMNSQQMGDHCRKSIDDGAAKQCRTINMDSSIERLSCHGESKDQSEEQMNFCIETSPSSHRLACNDTNIHQHDDCLDQKPQPSNRPMVPPDLVNKDQNMEGELDLSASGSRQIEGTLAKQGINSPRLQSAQTNQNIAENAASNESECVELRLLVRRREAGALIGKRGTNIKRLRDLFSSSIFSIPDSGNGPERVVCIVTCRESMEAILADVTKLMMEKSPEKDDQVELKLLIHSSHAGSIIGIGGQSIKKLRNDSRAAIKIYEMCCPLSNERVCAIKGRPPVVVNTIKMLQMIRDQNPIKGTIKPYDALNFDLNLVDKYGGYLTDELSQTSPSMSSNLPSRRLTPPLDHSQSLAHAQSHRYPHHHRSHPHPYQSHSLGFSKLNDMTPCFDSPHAHYPVPVGSSTPAIPGLSTRRFAWLPIDELYASGYRNRKEVPMHRQRFHPYSAQQAFSGHNMSPGSSIRISQSQVHPEANRQDRCHCVATRDRAPFFENQLQQMVCDQSSIHHQANVSNGCRHNAPIRLSNTFVPTIEVQTGNVQEAKSCPPSGKVETDNSLKVQQPDGSG